MILQKENASKLVTSTIDHFEDRESREITYERMYSMCNYPMQTMSTFGVIFPKVPLYTLTKNENAVFLWGLSAMLVRVEVLWQIIGGIHLHTSQCHGWLMMYLHRSCFNLGGQRQKKIDPFQHLYISTIDKLCSLMEPCLQEGIGSFFNEVPGVLFLHSDTDQEFPEIFFEEGPKCKIIIMCNFELEYDSDNEYVLNCGDKQFELLTVIGMSPSPEGSAVGGWDGYIYSRHGGYHSHWWYDDRFQNIPVRKYTLPKEIPESGGYLLVYRIIGDVDVIELKKKFMVNLGGQSHVLCDQHRLPLIESTERSRKCKCGKKEHYRCCEFDCKVVLCRKCFVKYDIEETVYIQEVEQDVGSELKSESRKVLLEPHDTCVVSDDDEYGDGADEEDGSIDREDMDEVNLVGDDDEYDNDVDEDGAEITADASKNVITPDEEELIEPYDIFKAVDEDDSVAEKTDDVQERNDRHMDDSNGRDNFLTTALDVDLELEDDDFGDGIDGDGNRFDSTDFVNDIATTNAAQIPMQIEETVTEYGGTFGNIRIAGHVLLNQCGTLLTRKKYQLKGSSRHRFFLQRLCATSCNSSIPLMYPEGTLFPSIHWKMAPDKCAIVGCLPVPLLSDDMFNHRFGTIQSHIRSRLTNPGCASSTDSRYISHCYDVMTNVAANHEDTRLILNRGLTVGDDKYGGLCVRGKSDNSLMSSIDSKQMVRNLCCSGKYHKWTHFLTFTCNQKNHFGTAPIKNWLDNHSYIHHFPNYFKLEPSQQEEIRRAVLQSSVGLMMRVWEEVFLLFIDYLKKSKSSPFKRFRSIFARKEYQPKIPNLSHSHLITELDYNAMTAAERAFTDDLIRNGIFQIVRIDEVPDYIEKGHFTSIWDVNEVVDNAANFLTHRCNDGCLVKNLDGTMRCRKPNNAKLTKDNTRHTHMALPNKYSVPCLRILEKVGLTTKLIIHDCGKIEFESNLDYFHPKKHIPPTNPNDHTNGSPVISEFFVVMKGMQNAQQMNGAGGTAKYVCKYLAMVDAQNYVVIEVDGTGKLITKSRFLHNTKITSSNIAESKAKEKRMQDKNEGKCICDIEMLATMLKYPEIITNIEFKKVSTMPLELRGGIAFQVKKGVEDGAFVTTFLDSFRKATLKENWRQNTPSQVLILNDLKLSGVSVDKVSQFGLRPPELMKLFSYLGDYYRWFEIGEKIKNDKIPLMVHPDLMWSCWVDGLQRKVTVRKKALEEIMCWCDKVEVGAGTSESLIHMCTLFRKINLMSKNECEYEEDSTEYKF